MYIRSLVLILAAISSPLILAGESLTKAPNFLVLVADDLGTESLAKYEIGSETAVTPNLDNLADQGILLKNFWAQPSCSPTRAATLTGRYAFRTGVRSPLGGSKWKEFGVEEHPQVPEGSPREMDFTPMGPLPEGSYIVLNEMRMPSRPNMPPPPTGPRLDEFMLPQALKSLPVPYSTAAFGKWHLGDDTNGLADHPNLAGFDHFSGFPFGTAGSYFAWDHNTNGVMSHEFGYTDVRFTEDATKWINQQGDQAWFVWLSYSNPHTPGHLPPTELLNSDAKNLDPQGITRENIRNYFFAQIEAMDTLIGQLLDAFPEEDRDNTYVIFFGDNGTVKWDDPPAPRDPNKVKGSGYEGGINVPLIISGPGIEGGQQKTTLGHVVDLYSTILDLAGAEAESVVPEGTKLDSVSFKQVLLEEDAKTSRTWAFAENGMGGGEDIIRNEEYKLILFLRSPGKQEFYHLASDPNELSPIDLNNMTADQQNNYDELMQIRNELITSE